MERVNDILSGKAENHIFPFLWLHGEEESVLREYMEKVQQSGIRAVCLEARPHPAFLKEKWWNDVDIILEEAKQRDMKIWILDDSHFPTGFAAGAVKEKYPLYRKRFLKLHQLDFAGPCKDAEAIISYAFSDKEDRLEGVYLAKKLGYEEIDASTITDITTGVCNNRTVRFELPEGEWKVMVLVSTYKGGEACTENYLNPIVPEATDVLLETVYEAHYEHYKEEFGKTILGFFSDEPRFGNMHGPEGSIGRYPMVLPWREDLAELLAERITRCGAGLKAGNGSRDGALSEAQVRAFLPLLFVDGQETAHQMRYHYMNLVSDLYAEHFSGRIGNWCKAHGVEYIGHTIEDNNASSRLGYGAGHFFRAMKGQDMAGIDVVLHQLMPGMDHGYNKAMTSKGWDGEFFHYVLGKLGSSLGHMDAGKRGRVMCEVFGAYGWSEGNRLMKWIADYMLVRGVNEFVPHAFDPKEYPDADCPPHFYAHGKNPQFGDFRILIEYMNRLAHLLSGGIHRAPVAVSYHGEAEWSGEYMLMQKPCAALARNQIDFDIVPPQAVVESQVVREESGVKFRVNQETFGALVVPYAEALPAAYLKKMLALAEAGVDVYILEELPVRSSEGEDVTELLGKLGEKANVVTLENLVSELHRTGNFEVQTSSYEPYLRYYHYEHGENQILMLVNETAHGMIETELEVPFTGNVYRYDAFENKIYRTICVDKRLKVRLEAYESAVYIWSDEEISQAEPEYGMSDSVKRVCLNGPFQVSFAREESYPVFSDEKMLDRLMPIQHLEGYEDFSGIIRYETTFFMEEMAEHVTIVPDKVYEGVRVSVNGCEKGVRICPPYRFDVSDAVRQGENKLVIEVTTTLGRAQKDWLSQFVLLEPTGITEAVYIEIE